METFANIINSVGFPIASFLIAVFGIKYVYDKESEQAERVTEKITTLAEAVAENTKTLAVLVNEIAEVEKHVVEME